MSSGVGVNSQCAETYQDLKIKNRDKGVKYKYIIFKLSDDMKEIVVDKTSEETDYDVFLTDLPKDQPRWAVYDVEFDKGEGKRNKLTFFSWIPEGAKIKQKMVYASSKDALRKSLDGIAADVQGTDVDEVSWETVLDKASRGK